MLASYPESANALIEMVRGYQLSQALYVAAALGVADQLAQGPQDCETLARVTGADKASLYRLLRTLASRGIFTEAPAGRFGLTDAAMPLRSDIPGSVRAQLVMWAHPMQWLPWGRLLDSVRSGQPAFPEIFGADFYEYLISHPHDAATFHAAMAAHQSHNQIVAACDLSSARLIVDIGGGNGRLIATLLRANPGAQGVLLDRPNMIPTAAEVLRQAGVLDRCQVIGGDFYSDIPAGADAYVFSNVLMDQQDLDALTLLRASKSAMSANGRVIIIERVIPAGNTTSLAQLSDLMALVVTGGRIRSESEFDQLFDSASLRRKSSILLSSGYTILELHSVEAQP